MLTRPSASTPMTPALDARQHRLGKTPATVDQVARAHEVVALGAQFLRHLVEGLPEMGEVAFRTADGQLHIEIAGGNNISSADQPADRRHQIVGEMQPDPDRRQCRDQGDHGIDEGETDLDNETVVLQLR